MQRKYIPITIIVAVLAAAAVTGFLMPAPAPETPVRVIMDNTGGRVLFTHQAHADEYGFDCTDCHHDDTDEDTFLACGTCHPRAFDETFRKEHQKAFESKDSCLRCHYDIPEGQTLPEEDRPYTEDIPLRLDAFHGQCMTCHEEYGGPTEEDSCYECHAR